MLQLGIVFGVGSAASWGAADFLGGMAARRSGAIAVAGGATVVGWIALLALLAIVRPPIPSPGVIGLAAAAGVAGGLGLVALYRGLSLGSMGLVAALSGVGSVVLPLVVVAWLAHDVIGAGQWFGMAAALAAAATASGATLRGVSSRALVMALLAAIGFGLWYVMLDQAATDGHELWVLVASRGASSVVVGWLAILHGGIASPTGLAAGGGRRVARPRRQRWVRSRTKHAAGRNRGRAVRPVPDRDHAPRAVSGRRGPAQPRPRRRRAGGDRDRADLVGIAGRSGGPAATGR
jgi:hypothetical protein